jgi:hypothetical protein
MPQFRTQLPENTKQILQRIGHTVTGPVEDQERQITDVTRSIGVNFGFTHEQLQREENIHQIIGFLTHRYCGVPDTPRQTSGTKILDYGSPIGRWGHGNLSVGVMIAGFKGQATLPPSPSPVPNPQAIAQQVYAQYQTAAPFFSFTFQPQNIPADITIQFGGDPSLGTPGGPIGLGSPPESGSLKLDAGTTWTQPRLLSIMLHEAGHTLGLSHSTNPTSVMYPFVNGFPAVLDAETIEAIQSIYGWTPQISLQDRASSHGPSLAVVSQPQFGGAGTQTLYMAWKGTEGDSSLWFSQSTDGKSWTQQQNIPGVGSSDGPCLATFHPASRDGYPREGLFMAWKGVEDDHNIYWAMNPNLDGWTGQQRIDVGTSARPALIEFNNQMILSWKGVPGDSGIYWSKFDGNGNWSSQQQIVGRGTSSPPVLAVFGGQLHMFWKGIGNDNTVYHAVLVDPGNGIWGPQQQVMFVDAGNLSSGETPIAIGTSDGLAATVRNNELVLIWKGVPGDHTLWFSRFNGNTFSGQVSISNVGSEAGPAIANLNGRLVAVWRGIGNDHGIWISNLG